MTIQNQAQACESAIAAIIENGELNALEQLKVQTLGRKGWLKQAFNQVKQVEPSQRKQLAQELNSVKAHIEAQFAAALEQIQAQTIKAQVDSQWLDMTMPGRADTFGAMHPLTDIERRCVQVLAQLGFEVVEGPEIETSFHNFDALNIPEHHPARDMQDTFWLDEGYLLRSHTSTVQIRTLEQAKRENLTLPIKIIAPGRVYRNETVDATHLACFHQFEGLWVDTKVSFAELKAVLGFIIEQTFGDAWEMRFKPKFYPYTEPSIGVDIRRLDPGEQANPWLTILGAGMVHPHVFTNTGFDPSKTKGFAFGLGISRMVAMAYGVESMRSLYELDLRVHQRLANQ